MKFSLKKIERYKSGKGNDFKVEIMQLCEVSREGERAIKATRERATMPISEPLWHYGRVNRQITGLIDTTYAPCASVILVGLAAMAAAATTTNTAAQFRIGHSF